MSNKYQQVVIPNHKQNGTVSVYEDTVTKVNSLDGLHEEDEQITDSIKNGSDDCEALSSTPLPATQIEDLETQMPQLLDKLRELLKAYPNCKRREDEFLAKFVRVKDYNVTKALESVRNFYRNIERNHHIIEDIRPSYFRALYDTEFVNVLSTRGGDGSKVTVIRMTGWDPTQHTLEQILQACVLLFQHGIHDIRTQLRGTTIIFDMEGLSLGHVRQVSPSIIRQLVVSAQEGLPIRIAGLHFINYPGIFWGIFYVAKGFMKKKLRQRIHFHQDLESLHEKFRREMLPKELGGTLPMKDVVDKEFMERLFLNDLDYSHYY